MGPDGNCPWALNGGRFCPLGNPACTISASKAMQEGLVLDRDTFLSSSRHYTAAAKVADLFGWLLAHQTPFFFLNLLYRGQKESYPQPSLCEGTAPCQLVDQSICSSCPGKAVSAFPLFWLLLALWQCPSQPQSRSQLLLIQCNHTTCKQVIRRGGQVANLRPAALFSSSAWVLALRCTVHGIIWRVSAKALKEAKEIRQGASINLSES